LYHGTLLESETFDVLNITSAAVEFKVLSISENMTYICSL